MKETVYWNDDSTVEFDYVYEKGIMICNSHQAAS